MVNLLDRLLAYFSRFRLFRSLILFMYNRDKVFDKLTNLRKRRVLDFGCGLGFAQYFFEDVEYVGIDIDQERLELAKKMTRKGKYMFELVNESTSSKNKFSLIFMHSVYHHLNNPKKVLKLIEKSMQKNGLLVLIEPRPTPIDYIWDHLFERPFYGYVKFPQTQKFTLSSFTVLNRKDVLSLVKSNYP